MPSLLANADMAADSLAGVPTQHVKLSRWTLFLARHCLACYAKRVWPWLCLECPKEQVDFALGCALSCMLGKKSLSLVVP